LKWHYIMASANWNRLFLTVYYKSNTVPALLLNLNLAKHDFEAESD